MIMRYFGLTIIIVFILGCPEKPCRDVRCGDELGDFVDPAITAIGGAIDDQIDSLFAANSTDRRATFLGISIKPILVGYAWAAACARPSTAACVNETRSFEYASCIIDTTPFILDGIVNLAYTGTPNCGFTAVGDTVTRTMNVSRTIVDNGFVKTFNVNIADRNAVGGGTKLTITSLSSFNLEILGVHKAVNNNANVIKSHDIDLQTTEPLTITGGGLERAVRNINGGTLEIRFDRGVITLQPHNLTYSADCCYPVSGSISFSGFARSGAITFPRCGTATIATEGANEPYDVSLVSCE